MVERLGRLVDRAHLAAQPRRHHLVELGERAQGRLAGTGHGAAGRHPERDGHRHGFGVIEQQWREPAPPAQLVATADTLGRLNRVAQRTQALDVAADAARSDAEPLGELGPGPDRALLEQPQQA